MRYTDGTTFTSFDKFEVFEKYENDRNVDAWGSGGMEIAGYETIEHLEEGHWEYR